jgi:hypothetical protein
VSYSDIARGTGSIGLPAPASDSTQSTTTGQTQAAATVAESVENSLGSGPTAKQPEAVISGLSNLKLKMDKIDQERELFKAEHAKLEDEVSSVNNSLSKLGDYTIAVWQDMTKLSSTLREELAEFKNILLSMSKTNNAPSPRRKAHRQSQNSDSASASSNDKKIMDSDTYSTDKIRSLLLTGLKKQSYGIICVIF